MKISKSLKNAYKKIPHGNSYSSSEAIKLMIENSTVKFDPSAEVHFRLNINPKHAEEQIRSTVMLPHGTGKTLRTIVFCEENQIKEAQSAGAIEAGFEELIKKIEGGWLDFDIVVAVPAMMPKIAKLARILGPKGLMPNPKSGTVTPDATKAVKELADGRIEIRNDKNSIVHTTFGKLSFGQKKLEENFESLIKSIKELKPATVKSEYFVSISINSTMGAGIKLNFDNQENK